MIPTSLCVLLYLSTVCSAPVKLATGDEHDVVSVHVNGHNSLYVGPSIAGGPMQIDLTRTSQPLSTITIGKATHTLTTNNCYYNGIVLQEHSQAGWASVFMCNKSLHGVLTIHEEMYQLHQTTSETYKLKLISSGNAKESVIRSKRHEHLVSERTIEVSIVVDEIMSNYHKENNLELYLFDVMNTVAHLFRHPTTESIIKIAVVNITVLKENDLKLSGNENGELLKHIFCQWKRDQEMTSDISILLTRRSICESTDSCGILGITTLNSMCVQAKSCAVIKDTGLSSAFTIAHEIGHSLGMHHDGDKNTDCNSGNYIMSSSLEGSTNPHQWSDCSKQQLQEFLSSSQSSCLKNDPSTDEFIIESVVPLPGKNYTLDEQCELLFGTNAVSCEKTNCSMLWCSTDNGVTCSNTQYSPPAAGSPCSSSSGICYHGQCIDSNLVTNTVDGGWGQWSGWSECTVSCGRGIQHSDRTCNSPVPQFSGRYCVGSRRRYSVCHEQQCPADMKSYRDRKCSELGPSSNTVHGATSTADHWISVDEKQVASFYLNPCKLYCQREGQSDDFTVLEDVVSNGVSCHTHHMEKGVCIDGSCIKVGCDSNLNTHFYTDMCGVTCGDNSTCQLVKETFSTDKLLIPLDVITIPSGSYSIAVTDISADPTDSYIIAEDVHTEYVFNQSSGINYALLSGTFFYFSHNGLTLKASGPIKNDVKIKVFVKTGVTKLNYTFIAPANSHESGEWSTGDWSECTSICGPGVQTRSVTCKHNGQLVDEEKCSGIAKPDMNKTCELEDCSMYSWNIGQWSECSSDCGKGVREREVICTHTNTSRVVDEQYCIAVRPDERLKCNATNCPKWEQGNWSQCSVTCGTGSRTRQVQCVNSDGSVSVNCDQTTKPVSQMQCNLSDCPSAICQDTFPECLKVKSLEYCQYFMNECCKTCSN